VRDVEKITENILKELTYQQFTRKPNPKQKAHPGKAGMRNQYTEAVRTSTSSQAATAGMNRSRRLESECW
jgi:hypothetical protein